MPKQVQQLVYEGNLNRKVAVLSAIITKCKGRTRLFKARAFLRKCRTTLPVNGRKGQPEISAKEQDAVLSALIDQLGRRTSLAQALRSLKEKRPKRCRIVFSTNVFGGVLQVVAQNTGGVQVRPIDVVVRDWVSTQRMHYLLNAGETSVTQLPGLYGEITVRRLRDNKVLARGVASPRPNLKLSMTWLYGAGVLQVDYNNLGGAMHSPATIVVKQGENNLSLVSAQLVAGGCATVHLDGSKILAGQPLVIKVTGMDDITVSVPEQPTQILDVEVAHVSQ